MTYFTKGLNQRVYKSVFNRISNSVSHLLSCRRVLEVLVLSLEVRVASPTVAGGTEVGAVQFPHLPHPSPPSSFHDVNKHPQPVSMQSREALSHLSPKGVINPHSATGCSSVASEPHKDLAIG